MSLLLLLKGGGEGPPPEGTPHKEVILADLPVAYWRVSELASLRARDQLGANHGEYRGTITRGVTGPLSGGNPAVELNGVDEWIHVADSTSLDLGDVLSLEIWVKRDTLGASQVLFDKGAGAYLARFTSSNKIRIETPEATIATSTAAITDEDWHHVVTTKDGEDTFIYIDGDDVTEQTGDVELIDTTAPLSIGAAEDGNFAFFSGALDEIAVYDFALSPEEVAAHYASGTGEEADEDPEDELPDVPWLGDSLAKFEVQALEPDRVTEVAGGERCPGTVHRKTFRFDNEDGDFLSEEEEEAVPPTTRAEIYATDGLAFTCAHDLTRWYRWQTRFGESYSVAADARFRTITQFKHTDESGAIFGLYTVGTDILFGSAFGGDVVAQVEAGRHYDWKLEAVWSEDSGDALQRLYLDDELVAEDAEPLIAGESVYLKWGYYKDAAVPGGSIFHGGIVVAATKAELGPAYVPSDPTAFNPRRADPPLELDVEIETAEGAIFTLSADDLRAGNIPTGITFTTQRGDGFGTGSFTVAREILRDYPDLNLMDTARFVGRQGDIAYEGRIASMPRTDDPFPQITVNLVGWMTYLKSRPCSPLIIDRRLGGWTDPSTQRKADLYGAGFRIATSPEQGFQDGGAKGPAIIFTFDRFDGAYTEIAEAAFYAGGEDIGDLRFDFDQLTAVSPDATWFTTGALAEDDLWTDADLGADLNNADSANQSVAAEGSGRKYAMLQSQYTGSFTGDGNNVHAFVHPRTVGTHELPEIGARPEEGYAITDIGGYVLNTYYPKIDTSEIDRNTFALQQATWHDAAEANGYSILQQLNDLILAETNVWEDRKLYWHQADFSKYDWVFRTDDPGVTVLFQGDSIESFANGIVITYTDFWGATYKLYPSDHPELRDDSEDNPASRHGEPLWTAQSVPWRCTEAEALQFGRAYLGEWNRPKRPGVYRLSAGYILDGAGHKRQGWAVRNSQTLGILDHLEDFPRLITATGWSQDGLALDITVDAPPMTINAISARHELALQTRNLTT